MGAVSEATLEGSLLGLDARRTSGAQFVQDRLRDDRRTIAGFALIERLAQVLTPVRHPFGQELRVPEPEDGRFGVVLQQFSVAGLRLGEAPTPRERVCQTPALPGLLFAGQAHSRSRRFQCSLVASH